MLFFSDKAEVAVVAEFDSDAMHKVDRERGGTISFVQVLPGDGSNEHTFCHDSGLCQ